LEIRQGSRAEISADAVFFLEMGGGGEMVDAVKRGKEGKGV
jgi:hypothetical protein